MGFSLQSLLVLWSTGSRVSGLHSCGTQAQLLHGMWNLPGSGIELLSPHLACGFLTTGPPGDSIILSVNVCFVIKLDGIMQHELGTWSLCSCVLPPPVASLPPQDGGLSLVAASEDYSSLRCMGFSLQWPLLLWSSAIFLPPPGPQASPSLPSYEDPVHCPMRTHHCHPPPCEDLGVGWKIGEGPPWHLREEYKGSLSAGGSSTRQISESNLGYLEVTHPRCGCSGDFDGKGTLSS